MPSKYSPCELQNGNHKYHCILCKLQKGLSLFFKWHPVLHMTPWICLKGTEMGFQKKSIPLIQMFLNLFLTWHNKVPFKAENWALVVTRLVALGQGRTEPVPSSLCHGHFCLSHEHSPLCWTAKCLQPGAAAFPCLVKCLIFPTFDIWGRPGMEMLFAFLFSELTFSGYL